jgi:hypothetical protein
MNVFIAKLNGYDVTITVNNENNMPHIKADKIDGNDVETLLFACLTDAVKFEFNKNYSVQIKANLQNYNIEFDRQSSSSFTKFKETIEDIKKKKYLEESYSSENLKYRSEMKEIEIDSYMQFVPHGNGIEYFDTNKQDIKYYGEFENGKYDGYGTFNSLTKLFSIKCTTICANIPIDNVTLIINNNDKFEDKLISMDDIWECFNLDSDIEKENFIKSENFVDEVAYIYSDYSKDFINFANLTLDDKIIQIYKLLTDKENSEKCNFDDYEDDKLTFKFTPKVYFQFITYLIIVNVISLFSIIYYLYTIVFRPF